MKKKYIPIIGTISAGKSTFLKAFLGIESLQTGATTTTKFVCLIKHNINTSFYHVIPNNEKGLLNFIKEGEEIKEKELITKKIEEINSNLSNKKGTKNDIFYMLETPIKNIENIPLLENNYFMDIPGLNEDNTTYIEDIFSLINLKDILFEIVIFDSTSIGSDNILKIFKSLEQKQCLNKRNNIYILNKIDQCTQNGNENIIESFKQYFYQTFEDEKIIDKNSIKLNIYENYFIPMNSLLYEAETKVSEDFPSLLVIELFNYLEYNNNKEISTFFEFIKKRIELLINHGNINIDKELNNINEEDINNINKAIETVKDIISDIKNSTEIQLGFGKRKSLEKEMKKLYTIQKMKKYEIYHSESFIQLQEIIKNINIDNDNLASPPIIPYDMKDINFINENKENFEKDNKTQSLKYINNDIIIIEELDNFLNNTFKEIDPNNEFKNFKVSLQTLRENILGRKIRVAFIGNISVGKSTVLNSIIGTEILPTKDSECTYRGVILRHKNERYYKLYRTKLRARGKGLDEYYFFVDDKEPHCIGIKNIRDYLNNKNNDKNINDDDAYIVITGRLKIFDFINLEKNIINKIEFIDLPGPDRKNNTFNDKEYYNKILQFSNCCIYINEPKSIDDRDSVKRMREQYSKDKLKVFPIIRKDFIKTCLFLVNKSDSLKKESDKIKITNNIYKIIQNEEKDLREEEMNISFFSGKYFNYFLEIYINYVDILEKNPLYILGNIYEEWGKAFIPYNYSNFFKNRIMDKIDEKLELDLEEIEDINVPKDFQIKLKDAMNDLFANKFRSSTEEEEDKLIENLYLLNYGIKNKNFDKTKYSHLFFKKLKEVIEFSEKIQNQNLYYAIKEFFSYTDQLFKKEIDKEIDKETESKVEKLSFIKNEIVPKLKKLFEDKSKKIENIIDLGKYRCLDIIEEEIKNIEEIIKKANKDLDIASKNLEEKIEIKIQEINKEKEDELNAFGKEIENLVKNSMSKFTSKKSINFGKIDTNKGITLTLVLSIISSTLSGLAVRSGIVMVGESLIAGTLAATGAASITIGGLSLGAFLTGPIGIAIGFGVGITISAISLAIHYFSKSKRYKTGLEQAKEDISKNFGEIKNTFKKDFTAFKESFFSQMNVKLEIESKNINNIDEKKWNEIKKKYAKQKEIIEEKIKQINLEKKII